MIHQVIGYSLALI